MLVIIEWVDLCWKSTLIDKMNRLINGVRVFTVPRDLLPKRNNERVRRKLWKFYIERLEEAKTILSDPECSGQIIVFDRFHLSELVYGKVVRWYDSKDMEEYQKKVDDLLYEIDKLYGLGFIYLSDNTESIRQRFLEKGDEYITDKKLYHNLKVEYGKQLNPLEKKYRVVKINVFEQDNYWNRIIDELLLPDYKYVRQWLM